MGTLWQSMRYTFRVLARNPGFTAVAILSLALGIGANTAIFTLINALLLRDLPFRHPEQLVQLLVVRPDGTVPFSYPMFRELERNQRVFTGLIGWGGSGMFNVEVNGAFSRNHLMSVTGNCYSELGVTPLLGRLLVPEDSNPDSSTTSQVAVIGYDFWRNRFGGAFDVVGKQIRVEGHPFTIVGVTRKWFAGMTRGEPPDITISITAFPILYEGNAFNFRSPALLWLFVTGRLKDGVTIDQARAQIQSFWPDLLLATASTESFGPRRQRFLSMGFKLTSAAKGFSTGLRFGFARPLYVLAGIVALILLVACVNLANLMLARAAVRSHEMSVRVAIGAGRWSLARQVLTESLVLSLSGALLGLAFAYWGSSLLVALMTQGNEVPVTLNLSPDLRILTLTICIALLTGILFGLAPAWRASSQDPAAVLQQNARSLSGGASRLGKTLIITQVALSLILLLGAGLFVRSFQLLRSIDLGFQKESVLEIELYPKPGGYQNLDLNSYHKQLLDRISSLPGVRSVSFSDSSIPAADMWHDTVSPMSADQNAGRHLIARATEVSSDFFRTLGIPLLQGREFTGTDDQHHPRVVVVSSALAERLFPNGDAIGKTVRYGVMSDYQNLEIVGITGNARLVDLREAATPVIFLSYLQYPPQWGNLIVRTSQTPEALEKPISQAIDSLGHEYALNIKSIAQIVDSELVEERVTAMLSGFFAALALLLASIGLYGLMSYTVTRRTREIGIRVAVGAQRQNVLWLVLHETLTLALLGIAIGIPAALAASRLIASMLFGLSSSDLPTIVTVSLLLLVVALFAGYFPARRASTIDPIVALRSE
ncbi:MAG: ABC transporter permease [Candidatus Acidiferrum sp.]